MLAGLCAVLGVFALIGCSAAPPGAGPAQASTAAANPCTLLTSVQRHSIGVNPGQQEHDSDSLGGVSCTWSRSPVTQGDRYLARLVRGSVEGSMPSSSIDNLPTEQYTPTDTDQRTSCVFLVSITPNETLWAQYDNTGGNLRGLTHQVACWKDQEATVDMVSTFKSLPK
jgi:hypothetical protein